MFTQKAAPIAFANLAGFGIGKDEIGQVSTLQEIADALVGRVVEVPKMSSREYDGRRFQSWPIGGFRLHGRPREAPRRSDRCVDRPVLRIPR